MPSINRPVSRRIEISVWIVQSILALLFLFAGGMKLVMPIAALTQQGGPHLPVLFIRFIGVLETLGGLGLIVPGLAHLRAELTPLAAAGLIVIMSGATGATMASGPASAAILPVIVGLLAAFVALGRWKLAPHRGASRQEKSGLVLNTAH